MCLINIISPRLLSFIDGVTVRSQPVTASLARRTPGIGGGSTSLQPVLDLVIQNAQRDTAHPTRYHGVFAPASPDQARIVPSTRSAASTERGEVSVSDRQRAMSWSQRLRRVFAIDIETCQLVWFVTDGQTQGNGWSTRYRFVDPPPQ
jgi:hypothetical protein